MLPLVAALAVAMSADAESPAARLPSQGSFAAGGILSYPTGGTLKYWLTDNLAADVAVGYWYGIQVHGDFMYNECYFDFPEGEMNLVFGGGVKLRMAPAFTFGFQGLAGVEWFIPWAPAGVFAQLVPTFNILDESDHDWFFEPNLAIGARYYF